MKKILSSIFILLLGFSVVAQKVGIGTTTPDPSAALDVTSTTQGMLVPRMTTAQRTAISNAANGLLVFDVTTNSFWFKGNSSWIQLVDSVHTEVHRVPGNKLYMGLTDNVGVGISAPGNKVDIAAAPRTGSHSTNQPLYVTGDLLSNQGVEFRHSNGTQGVGIGFNTIYATGSSNDQDLGLASRGSSGNLFFNTNNTTRMKINALGNVGIGLTPISTLDIARGTASGGTLTVRGSEYNSQYYFGETESITLRGGKVGSNIYLNDAEDLGNVLVGTKLGIGTYNPNKTLSVANKFGVDANGSIHYSNVPRQIYFYEDGLPSKMILSHSPAFPTWGLQYTAANRFRFLADSASVMDIDLGLNKVQIDGLLGVGTSPDNKIDIHTGNARTGTHPTGLTLYATGDIGSSALGFEIRHNNGTQGVGIGYNTIYATGSDASQNLGLQARGPNGSILFLNDAIEKMRMDGQGYLGIGTSTPHALVHLSNAIQNRKIILYEVANNDHQFYGFGVNSFTLRYQVNSASDSHVFYAGNSATASTELMRITGAGNIGIGTSTPHAPLQFPTTTANRKIVLYEVGNNDHQFFGFGINPDGSLRYQTPVTGNDHTFYAGTSATTSNELLRIRGNGNLDVAGTVEMGWSANWSAEFSVPPLNSYFITCNCPAGTTVISGGGDSNSDFDTDLIDSYASSSTSWSVRYYNRNAFNTYTIKAFAICARMGN